MYRKLLLISLLFIFSSLQGQNKEFKVYQDLIYESFISNQVSIWEGTLGIMEASYKENPGPDKLYDIVLAQYGIVGYYLGFDNDKRGRFHIEKSKPYLEELLKTVGYEAQAYAFQSAFYGYEIALSPLKGAMLGPRSNRAADKAVEFDSDYVRVWIEKGNISFYTPSILGGSKSEAVKYYSKAIDIFEKNGIANNHRWLYLNTLISLAKSYEYIDDVDSALKIMDKVLEYEPDFKWAKEDYLPGLKSQDD